MVKTMEDEIVKFIKEEYTGRGKEITNESKKPTKIENVEKPPMLNILGTYYTIEYIDKDIDSRLKDYNAFCDYSSKRIIVDKDMKDYFDVDDKEKSEQEVIKHEIIHAFLCESGLHSNSCPWHCEEMVDWLALQFDKIKEVIEKAERI